MQTQWYPQSICDYLDKVSCKFVWKGSEDKGIHLVSWDKMTRHKKLGGLGIRIARFQNVALHGKLVWDFLNFEDKLWVKMFKDIYLVGLKCYYLKEVSCLELYCQNY